MLHHSGKGVSWCAASTVTHRVKLVLAAHRGRDSLLRDLTGPLEWGLLLESPFVLANCFPPLGTHAGLVGMQPWLSSLFE